MAFPPHYISTGSFYAGRPDPAEYVHNRVTGEKGWFQCRARRIVKKPHYHLVWPKDQDRGKFGRLKDILQGKGPDIHLSISAKKNDYAWNAPVRSRWSNWEELDPRMYPGPNMWPNQYKFNGPCWVENGKLCGRDGSKRYNFATRKYENWHRNMWTDAVWQGPLKHSGLPHQVRDVNGEWFHERTWNPAAPGQRIEDV